MIEYKKLPYDAVALEGIISSKTFSFHYDKHYKGYVDKLNLLTKGTDFETLSLPDMVLKSASDTVYTSIFNNAAQVYNHEFYFASLSPKSDEAEISPDLMRLIERDFISVNGLKEKIVEVGSNLFGSGYVWIVYQEGKLKVVGYKDAFTPLTEGGVYPILSIDLWEHSYYLDYQNLRPQYLKTVVNGALNWAFASKNYQNVKGE